MFHISYLPAASVSQFPVHTVGSNNNKVGSEAGPKTCFPFYFSCFSGDVALFFSYLLYALFQLDYWVSFQRVFMEVFIEITFARDSLESWAKTTKQHRLSRAREIHLCIFCHTLKKKF